MKSVRSRLLLVTGLLALWPGCADRAPADPVVYTWHRHLLPGRYPALARTPTGVALACNDAGRIMLSAGGDLRFEQVPVSASEYSPVYAAWALAELQLLVRTPDVEDKTWSLLSDGASGWTASTTPANGLLEVASGPGRLLAAGRVGWRRDDLLFADWGGASWTTRRLENVGYPVDGMGGYYDPFEYDLAVSAQDELRLVTFDGCPKSYSEMLLWTESSVGWQQERIHPAIEEGRTRARSKLGLSIAAGREIVVAFVLPAEQGDRIRLIRGEKGSWRQEDLLDPILATFKKPTHLSPPSNWPVTGYQLTSVAMDAVGATYVATVRRRTESDPYEIVVAHDRTGQWTEEVVPIEPPAGQPDMPPTSLQMVVDRDRAIHLVYEELESADSPHRACYAVGSPRE